MYNDLLDYLQSRGKCERWVLEWYFHNKEQMRERDPVLYKFARYIHARYF